MTYDDDATLQYKGTLTQRNGEESAVFHIVKPDVCLIVIYATSADGIYCSAIEIAGDYNQAEKLLLAFKMADGAWAEPVEPLKRRS